MDEDTAYELTLGMIVVFLVFNHLYPGAAFMALLVGVAALVASIYFVRGCAEWFLGRGHDNFWAGVLFIVIIVMFFNGLPAVEKALGAIGAFVGGAINVGAEALAAAI